MKYISYLIALVIPALTLGFKANPVQEEKLKVVSEPTIGTLATAIANANDSGNGNYTKTTTVTELSVDYPNTYPWNEHNPMVTNYTKDGLYMVDRGSGYYTFNNQIWHYSNVEGVETRALSMSNYEHYYNYYKTLRDFDGTYVTSKLNETAKEGSNGLIYTNKDTAYSTEDYVSLIYFAAPLVKINEGTVVKNFSCEFAIKNVDDVFVLDSITVIATLTVSEHDYPLKGVASFSKIGTTELGYTLE
jgi:hypothetical protein